MPVVTIDPYKMHRCVKKSFLVFVSDHPDQKDETCCCKTWNCTQKSRPKDYYYSSNGYLVVECTAAVFFLTNCVGSR